MAERWDERERAYRRDERDYRGQDQGDRDRTDRAADEVKSWFGDDAAAQRRRMDEAREAREPNDRASYTAGRAWDRARESMADVTDRDRDGRRGFAEWKDNDRPDDRWTQGASRYGVGDEWNRDRGYRDVGRYGQERNSGAFAGRGPRGYTRGDERIREDVCDRLTDDARIDASDIDVQVKDGEVTLNGSVRTREEKRFTEDLIERISGVRDVSNHLKVKAADAVLGTARSGSSVLGLTDAPPPPPDRTK
jgi:osmotically-inducible protein OsmY